MNCIFTITFLVFKVKFFSFYFGKNFSFGLFSCKIFIRSMRMSVVFLIIGFIVIVKASDILVDAASSLAMRFGVPKMLIALTIVAFGTCAPEVAISFQSVAVGNSEMAFANVIGSCIVNVFLILGIASFLRPIKVKHITIKKELSILFLVTTCFSVLMLDSMFNPMTSDTFSRSDGFILILVFFIFVLYLVNIIIHRNQQVKEEEIKYPLVLSLLLIVVSILLIIYSSDLIVNSATDLARALHISDKVITMFAVVIGTSLPEMVMTVTSAKKGEFDMALGNIIGTNIFNICIVLGLPIVIYGDMALIGFGFIDIFVLFLSSFLLFWFARSERTINRREAVVMLGIFIFYYIYLII